jgi:hypothetical protein
MVVKKRLFLKHSILSPRDSRETIFRIDLANHIFRVEVASSLALVPLYIKSDSLRAIYF